MAGLARPNNIKGIEGKITINDSYLRVTYNYEGTNLEVNSKSGCPALFNGISETNNLYKNFVLMANGYGENYIDFTVDSKSNIYAIGNVYSDSGGSSPNPLHFYKYNDSDETWELIGDVNTQSDNTWYLLLSCDKGRYKLVNYLNYVGFTEWFVESVASNLIKSNNRYYSIHEEFYDSSTKSYIPLDNLTTENFTEKAFSLSELTTEITIGDETFRPIDKFDNFNIVSNKAIIIQLTGIKSDKELIISRQNLSLSSAKTIHQFKQSISSINNANCKTVFSLDNGVTWKSYDSETSSIIDLTNTITLVDIEPNNLSEVQQIEWNNLRDEIFEKGMDNNTIQLLDFTELFESNKYIRFAHVLYRPSYEDKTTLQNITWVMDEEGQYVVTDEVKIGVNKNKCTATATKENLQNVKVNLLI